MILLSLYLIGQNMLASSMINILKDINNFECHHVKFLLLILSSLYLILNLIFLIYIFSQANREAKSGLKIAKILLQ